MYYEHDAKPGWMRLLLERLGPKAVLMWTLLLVQAICITFGMAQVLRGLEFGLLFRIAVIAMTMSWLFALLPMSSRLAAAISAALGAELIVIWMGGLTPAIWEVVRAGVRLIGEFLLWYWREIPPDWTAFLVKLGELWGGGSVVVQRGASWLLSLLSGTAVFDPVGTALVWGLLTWWIFAWCGWVIRRHYRPLLAILPAGALLSFLLSYAAESAGILLPLVGLTLVLMALVKQRAREFRWVLSGIDFSQDLWTDLTVAASLVAVLIMITAALAPSLSAKRLVRWVQELAERRQNDAESVAESLGVEQRSEPRELTTLEEAQWTTLPQRHLIGSGPELSRLVVMTVKTGDLPPVPDVSMLDRPPQNYYWRSLTYDNYTGRGWKTSRTEMVDYKAGETAVWPDILNHRIVRQEVQFVGESGGMVHVAGTLSALDQPYEVAWRPPGEVFAASIEVPAYRADSIVPVFTEEQLREAKTNYPSWILDRYLQLPDEVPERVLGLARELTAVELTPYDRALAIESYLREYPYTLDVPYPPMQQDIADYFLFDLKKGYCDYYATSMVVLARAAGLPTRLAIGFASGFYDAPQARYVVTEANAHAWVEIYFPGYGWVPFEPTGGLPSINRTGAEEEEPLIWPEEERVPLVTPVIRSPWLSWTLLFALFAGAIAVVLGATGIDSALLRLRYDPDEMTTHLYHRLLRYAKLLRVKHRDGDTPHEFAQAFARRMDEIVRDRKRGRAFLLPAAEEIRQIVEDYVVVWYTPHALNRERQRVLVRTWWVLRWRLLLARLWKKVRRERAPMPTSSRRPADDLPQPPRLPPM